MTHSPRTKTIGCALLGLALGSATSCLALDRETFNLEAMTLAAEIHEACGLKVGDNEVTPTPYLQYKREDLDACAQECRFREDAARKCLRRLERMADTCEVLSLAPCRRVYVDCVAKFDHNRCDLGKCSVSTGDQRQGALLALVLLALGWIARRPR